MATNKSYHVIPDPNGGWVVKKGGSERASKRFDTKSDAVEWGRQTSRNQGSDFVVHKQDGRIERMDSYGRDPRPLRGRDTLK
jgi:hypothetical protein